MNTKSKKRLASNLNHQITFLENITNNDLIPEKWIEKTKSFAEITPLYPNRFESIEGFDFAHVMTEGFFLFKIRFTKGIVPKMRILFKDRNFEIKRIINIKEQDRILQIIALEF
jgi:head-tail adaptor